MTGLNRQGIRDEDVCCLNVLQVTIQTRMQVREASLELGFRCCPHACVLRFETAVPRVRIAAVLLLLIVETEISS